jgi:transcriptional regulator with XRE-family HTH domain
MPYKKEHKADEIIRQRIKDYIAVNKLSPTKIAREMGLNYQQFYHLLTDRRMLKLGEYIKLCQILNEPFDFFISDV